MSDVIILNASEPGVYYLLRFDRIVYIGRARNVFTRVATHMRQKRIEFDSWRWERIEDEDDRWMREGEMIRIHQPKYNTNGCCNYPLESQDVIDYATLRKNGKARYRKVLS